MKKPIAAAFTVATLVGVAAAESPATADPGTGQKPEKVCGTPNGCGPAGAPATVKGYGNVSFADACETHDYCYATLGKTQADCDNAFRRDMYALCAQQKAGRECEKMADLFYSGPATTPFGKEAYTKAQQCAHTVAFTNGEIDADFILANAKNEGSNRADAAAKVVLEAASAKRRVIQDAAAEIKSSTLAIHQYAGMTYTYSPPAPAAALSPEPQAPGPSKPGVSSAIAALGGADAAKKAALVCARKTANEAQLCVLATNARGAADATATQVPAEDMKYDDQIRDLVRGSNATAITAKYVDGAIAAARDAKATYAKWRATPAADAARKGLLQAEAMRQTEDARLKWNAIKSEIDREVRASAQSPFSSLVALEREITTRRAQVASWKSEADKLAPGPSPARPSSREAPRKIMR